MLGDDQPDTQDSIDQSKWSTRMISGSPYHDLVSIGFLFLGVTSSNPSSTGWLIKTFKSFDPKLKLKVSLRITMTGLGNPLFLSLLGTVSTVADYWEHKSWDAADSVNIGITTARLLKECSLTRMTW